MKNHVLFMLLLLVPFFLTAQSFDAGVKAGISASQISGDTYSGWNKPGIYAGIFTSFDVSERSRFALEINYIEKGSRDYAQPDEGDYESYKLMLNYVEVPLTYQFFINDKLSLEIGPSYGILLKKENHEVEPYDNRIINNQDNPPFRNYEVAWHTGFNYYINEQWMGGVRHSESLIPVRKHNSGATYWFNRGQHINMLRFYVAYIF